MILQHLLRRKSSIQLWRDDVAVKDCRHLWVEVLRTCKQLYNEGGNILYGDNTFMVVMEGGLPEEVLLDDKSCSPPYRNAKSRLRLLQGSGTMCRIQKLHVMIRAGVNESESSLPLLTKAIERGKSLKTLRIRSTLDKWGKITASEFTNFKGEICIKDRGVC